MKAMHVVLWLAVHMPLAVFGAEMPEDSLFLREQLLRSRPVVTPFEWTFTFKAKDKWYTLEITSAHLKEKYFLEHRNGVLVTVFDPNWGTILSSEDDGASWKSEAIPPPPQGPQTVRALFTTSSGAYIAERAGINEIWQRDPRGYWSNTGLRFTWLGSASIAESDGVIMAAEYPSDLATIARVIRSFDDGKSWEVVMSRRSFSDPSPEIRHFHTMAVDPWSGHWYVSSGDTAACSRIWKSDDHGDTWDEVTDIDVTLPTISHPRTLHRYTDIWFDDGRLIWGTDDRLEGTGSRLVMTPRTEPLQLVVMGRLGATDVRSAIDFGDDLGHLLITENNIGYAGIEIVLVTRELEIVPIGILEGQTGYLTCSFASWKAEGDILGGLKAFARAKDMQSLGGSPRYPFQTWEYKIRRLFRVNVQHNGHGTVSSDISPDGCRYGEHHTLTMCPEPGYLLEALYLNDGQDRVLWAPRPICATREVLYDLEIIDDMQIMARFIPVAEAGLPAISGRFTIAVLVTGIALGGAWMLSRMRST